MKLAWLVMAWALIARMVVWTAEATLRLWSNWQFVRGLKAPSDPQHDKRREIELQVERGGITTIKRSGGNYPKL